MHFNQYNKKCNVCGIISKTREEHRDHLVTHKLKVYSCQVCHKDFVDSRALKVHTFNAHSAITQSMNLREYRCQECDKQFFSTKGLKNHLKTHRSDFRMYSCSICNKLFITEQGMASHMKTHATNKEHTCELCNKHFNSSAYAAFHRKQHILDTLNEVLMTKDKKEKQSDKESVQKKDTEVNLKNDKAEDMAVEREKIVTDKSVSESENAKQPTDVEIMQLHEKLDFNEIQAAFPDYVIRLHPFKQFCSFYFFKASDAQDLENSGLESMDLMGTLTDTRNNAWFQMSDSDKKARGFAMYRCNFCRTFKMRKREILRHNDNVHAKRDSYSCEECSAV